MSDDRNEVIRAHQRLGLVEQKLAIVIEFLELYNRRLHPMSDIREEVNLLLKTLKEV